MPAVEFQPHQKQWDFIQDPADVVLAVAGKRGGKTCAAAIKFIQDITDNLKAGIEGNYLIVGPTYNLLRNGTVPTLMKYWPRRLGTYRRSESRIKLPNGKNGEEHYVFILSADEPDRIEAFGVLEAWLDEAGQYRQEVWDKVQQRLTTMPGRGSGRVIFSTSPYGAITSWLNQDLILRAKNMPWVKVHRWSTFDNPFIDHTIANRFRETGNPQIFQRDFMGEYTQIEGLIYPDFNRQSDNYVVTPFKVPKEWPLFCGIDYGFTDPTVILILAKDPEAKIFYIIGEYYKDGRSVHGEEGQLKDWQKFLQGDWPSKIRQLLYDPSAVGIMTLLKQVSKMNLVEAEGGPGSVAAGINRVTWLIKKHRLKFFNTCEKTIEDMEAYVYATTGKRDGKPAHDNSHGPDALRYAFSKDLLGIFPELKRPEAFEDFKKNFNEKGEYIPSPRTLDQIFDLKKDKKNLKKQKVPQEKEPGECFEYAPKYEPWKEDD